MSRLFSQQLSKEFLSITAIKIILQANKHKDALSDEPTATDRFCATLDTTNNALAHNGCTFKDLPLFWPKHWHLSIVDPLSAIYRLLESYSEGLPSIDLKKKPWVLILVFCEKIQRRGSVDELISFVYLTSRNWVICIEQKCYQDTSVWSPIFECVYFIHLFLPFAMQIDVKTSAAAN